jgi:hypothetical protein
LAGTFTAEAGAAAVGAKIFIAFCTVNVRPHVNGTKTTSQTKPINSAEDFLTDPSDIANTSTFVVL